MALILPSPLYPLFLALLISFFLSLSFSNCHSGGRVGMPPLPHIELPASSVVEISGNVASLMRSAAWLSLRQHYGLDSIPVLSIEIKRFSFKHAKDFKGEKNVVLVIDLWVSLLSFAFFLCVGLRRCQVAKIASDAETSLTVNQCGHKNSNVDRSSRSRARAAGIQFKMAKNSEAIIIGESDAILQVGSRRN